MRIIRNYYSQSKREIEEMEKELETEKKEKTSEQLQLEAEKRKAEGQCLFEKFEKMQRQTMFVRNKEKYGNFETLYEGALAVAKCLDLNVEISTENSYAATIKFTADSFYLVKDVAKEIHLIMGMLFAVADDTWIDREEGLLRIIFFYQINDVLRK